MHSLYLNECQHCQSGKLGLPTILQISVIWVTAKHIKLGLLLRNKKKQTLISRNEI